MKKHRRLLFCFCVVAAILTMSLTGTLAYLTNTDFDINKFAIGEVSIKLDEAKVSEDGIPIPGAERVRENNYFLIPGMTYTKDPTITVQPNTESAYIRMFLTIHNASVVQEVIERHNLGDFFVLIGGWDGEDWVYQGATLDETANAVSLEFRYKTVVSTSGTEEELPPLFETLIIPGELTSEEMAGLSDGGFKMVVTGQAIQSAGFTTAEDAWVAFDHQVQP